MGFVEAIRTCLRKYVDFNGRARRSEYWWFALFIFLVQIAAIIIEMGGRITFISGTASLALFLPQISVTVRRLHDINRSGWWIGGMYIFLLIFGIAIAVSFPYAQAGALSPATSVVFVPGGLIGFVYGVTLFVFSVRKGTDGPNDYGPDPLANDITPAPSPARAV